MEIKHIQPLFFFLLLLGFISCATDKDACKGISLGNENVLFYVKPFFPSLADVSNSPKSTSLSSNGHIHFVIRVEKDTPFTEVESAHLREAIKNDISLDNNGLELTRSLFIYEALFPSDNLAQFIIAYANPGNKIEGNYSLNMHSEIFALQDKSVDIPKDCLQ
jgi:hypothetical protein